jgi:hypothetical protein
MQNNTNKKIVPELQKLISNMEKRTASPHKMITASARSGGTLEKKVHQWMSGAAAKPNLVCSANESEQARICEKREGFFCCSDPPRAREEESTRRM